MAGNRQVCVDPAVEFLEMDVGPNSFGWLVFKMKPMSETIQYVRKGEASR